MATSGEGNQPKKAATQQQHQSRMARRRLSQARHRATMMWLFSKLRKKLYYQSDLIASKWQVLNKAKMYIQELEQTLDNVLKLKESFNLEDGNANSLEEVKEVYARNYSESDSNFLENSSPARCPAEAAGDDAMEGQNEEEREEDQQEEEEEEEEEEKRVDDLHSEGTLSPDLLEFERYLNFYKQVMDLLMENSIISPQDVTRPIVSAAISHLWQSLSEEKKANLLQAWEQRHSGLPDLKEVACLELAYLENSPEDSGVDSQGASCSLASTPEEILFEDAFDVASFLDKSEAPGHMSVEGDTDLQTTLSGQPEEKFQLYMQIIDFLKSLCCVNTQLHQ
uniref:Stimulated by retinoic acid gene 8 n=1 Tax=Jaculus jaculus TaxID=51337 RepID=A0A8C5P438_JACJA